jgi:trimethylamine--corrinoid protein Co-methyltransferase
MAHLYGLPGLTTTKKTDSCTFDEQCGAEKIMEAFAVLASGIDVLYGCGDLDSLLVLSLEQIVIDLDLVLAARRFVHGINVNHDTLAVDAIKRVGIGGNYLTDEHTLRFLRSGERLAPRTYNRLGHRSTAKAQLQRAHEIVEAIVSKPAEPVISEQAILRIRTCVEEREREILGNA